MTILITRPTMQAASLAKTLAQQHINSICFPVLDIAPPNDLPALRHILQRLPQFEVLIFVSPNAITQFLQYTERAVLPQQCVLAMGKGSAALLQKKGIAAVYPQKANSEGLLALPELQAITGKAIVIFAGEQGKTLLADTLRKRGAKVTMAYTHYRQLPQYPMPLPWQADAITLSISTSSASLHHFRTMIAQYSLAQLLQKPLLVITTAMQDEARQLGFKSDIIVANGASDDEIIAALMDYRGRKNE